MLENEDIKRVSTLLISGIKLQVGQFHMISRIKMKSYIESFPEIESHCNRANNKKYLDSGLKLQIMHYIYFQKFRESNEKPVKIFA